MASGEKSIKQYTIGLALKTNDLQNKLKNVSGQLSSFSLKATKMLAIPVSIGAAFGALGVGAIKNFLETGRDLELFSNRTGIAVESVSTLGGALREFGGDTETAKSSLEGLQNSLYEAQMWGSGALMDAGRKYGLNAFDDNGQLKDTNGLMESLADTMGRLSKPAQQELGAMLGLDNSVISLLQKGKDGYRTLINEQAKLNPMTKADAVASKAFADQIIKMKQHFEMIGRTFSRAFLPAMKQISKAFEGVSKWIKDNERLFSRFASSLGDSLIPMLKVAGVAIAVALAPAIRAAAPLAAVLLLIDDIVGYFNGKNSLTGKFLDEFPKLKEKFIGIKDSFMEIFGLFKAGDFTAGIEKIGEVITGKIVPLLMDLGKIVLDSFIKYSPQITKTLLDIAGAFLKGLLVPLIGKDNAEAVGGFITNLQSHLDGLLEGIAEKIETPSRLREMKESGFSESPQGAKHKDKLNGVVGKWENDDINSLYETDYQNYKEAERDKRRQAMDARDKARGISNSVTSGVTNNNANNPTVNNNPTINVTVKSTKEAAEVINGVSDNFNLFSARTLATGM